MATTSAQQQVDLKATLEMILDNAVQAVTGDAGAIALWNESERRFDILATYNLGRETMGQLLPLLDEVIPDLATSRESFDMLSTLAKGSPLPYSGTGILQDPIIVLPLQYGHEAIGLIYVLRPAEGVSFSRTEQRILAAFAQQAAIAVQNARLAHLLAEEKQRVESMLEGSAEGIMSIDAERRIIGFNSAMEKLTGRRKDEALGKQCISILNLCDSKGNAICHEQCPMLLPGSESVSTFEQQGTIKAKDGRNIEVEMLYSFTRSPTGSPLSAVINFHDISKLVEVENLRTTFLAMLGHELQTPLSLIKGYASTLGRSDGRWDDKVRNEGLQIIEEECDRLSKLVNRLLIASRIESGAMVFQKEAVQLPQLIDKLVRRFNTMTDIHTFEVVFDPDFPPIDADPELIEELFVNLVDNAIKYSPDGGRVEINGKVDDSWAEITIADEGIGIPVRDMDHLFERFSRGRSNSVEKVRGVGLGLFISRYIAEAHGGRTEAFSKFGRGSRFVVILPLQQAL